MAELDRNMSESDRRDIVRAIAGRKERGYEIKETTVQPQYDYAAAARAAVASDPVELPPAGEADLAAMTGAPSEAGSKYAEAQRAIFESGQGRELGYGNEWMDAQQGVVDASVFALNEYQAAVDAARAAADAYAAGSGSGAADEFVPSPFTDVNHPLTGATGTEKFQQGNIYVQRDTALHGPFAFETVEPNPNVGSRELAIAQRNPALAVFSDNLADYNDLKDYTVMLAATQTDTDEARRRIRTFLIEDGVPRSSAVAIANGVVELYADDFHDYQAAAWRSTSVPSGGFSSGRVPTGREARTGEIVEDPVFEAADMLLKKYGFQ